MTGLRQIIATNVENLRRERGHSQEALAKLLKVNKQTIWRLEKGSTNVGIDTLAALAKALHVDPPALLLDRSHKDLHGPHLKRLEEVLTHLDRSTGLVRNFLDNLMPASHLGPGAATPEKK